MTGWVYEIDGWTFIKTVDGDMAGPFVLGFLATPPEGEAWSVHFARNSSTGGWFFAVQPRNRWVGGQMDPGQTVAARTFLAGPIEPTEPWVQYALREALDVITNAAPSLEERRVRRAIGDPAGIWDGPE
jgi:hypothetical protein